MDPLTHGLLGAGFAGSVARRTEVRIAAGVGFAAGLLADADAFIRSDADPLLNLEFHRHFTHALAFAPVGALVAAALLWPWLRRRIGFARLYLFSLAGYALAGLLDACTSYGTHLWWPFRDARIAWSIISIVDPVFTLGLLALIAYGLAKRSVAPARFAMLFAATYLALGWVQQQRALEAAQQVALARGHTPGRLAAKPSLGNLLLWRTLYVHDGRLYADGIRVGLGRAQLYAGSAAPLLDPARDFANLPPTARVRRDLERFQFFSDGLLIRHPSDENFIGDGRYALLPTSLRPLWGIRIDPARAELPATLVTDRSMTAQMRRDFLAMLRGAALAP